MLNTIASPLKISCRLHINAEIKKNTQRQIYEILKNDGLWNCGFVRNKIYHHLSEALKTSSEHRWMLTFPFVFFLP